jgi:hypothetical protein
MFGQVLYVQWKWARAELFLYVLAAFLVPVLVMRIGYLNIDQYAIRSVLGVGSYVGVFFGSLAILAALGLAWRPYILDSGLRHVGPLSLPIAWGTFVRMRFLAGALLLVVPTIAVWIGGVLATATVTIPPTLHAYPGGIAIRFLFAALLAYSAAFALQYVAGRHATRVAVIGFFVVVLFLVAATLLGYNAMLSDAWHALSTWPGPLSVFNARWMLIDV